MSALSFLFPFPVVKRRMSQTTFDITDVSAIVSPRRASSRIPISQIPYGSGAPSCPMKEIGKPRNSVAFFSCRNFLTISATIESSGPLTLSPASLALALSTRTTVIAAIRPSLVNWLSPAVLNLMILFFCFSAVSSLSSYTSLQCLCSSTLPFCPVFGKEAFNVEFFHMASFCRYFPWHQATLERMSGRDLFRLFSQDRSLNRPRLLLFHGFSLLRESCFGRDTVLFLVEKLPSQRLPSVSESPRDKELVLHFHSPSPSS